jgi:hypothetical protein
MTGERTRAFIEALCDAFSPETLEQMLRIRLDKQRSHLCKASDLRTMLFEIIEVARREGWLDNLVDQACGYYPGNQKLQRFRSDYLRLASSPSVSFQDEAAAFRAAQRLGTLEAWLQFLEAHASGVHAQRARPLADELLWKRIEDANNPADADRYMALARANVISGVHIEDVKRWQKALSDDDSWKTAQELGTVKGFQQYLIAFKGGRHADEAGRGIDELHWNDACETNTVEAYETYIKAYPSGLHEKEAKQGIDELRWGDACETDTAEAYETYVKAQPGGLHEKEARSRAGSELRKLLLDDLRNKDLRRRYLAMRTPEHVDKDRVSYPWALFVGEIGASTCLGLFVGTACWIIVSMLSFEHAHAWGWGISCFVFCVTMIVLWGPNDRDGCLAAVLFIVSFRRACKKLLPDPRRDVRPRALKTLDGARRVPLCREFVARVRRDRRHPSYWPATATELLSWRSLGGLGC